MGVVTAGGQSFSLYTETTLLGTRKRKKDCPGHVTLFRTYSNRQESHLRKCGARLATPASGARLVSQNKSVFACAMFSVSGVANVRGQL